MDPDDNNTDSDGDGINDGADADPDGDGKNEYPDADNDGIRDRADADKHPEKPDTDGDGIIDEYDLDDDNDGISDEDEKKNGTNPLNPNDPNRPDSPKPILGKFIPVYDANNTLIGYKSPDQKSIIKADGVTPSTVEVLDHDPLEAYVAVTAEEMPENCSDYNAYAIMREDGRMRSGFQGTGCSQADSTTTKKGTFFAPGSKVRIRPIVSTDEPQYRGKGPVVVADIVVKNTVQIGGK